MLLFLTIVNTDDKTKLERLYYTYRRIMYLEAYKVLGDKYLAEDAVSESFVRILNKLDRIDEDNKNATKSFLSIISRNVAIDLYKKKLHLNNNENMVDSVEDKTKIPEDFVVSRESTQRLAKIIENLNEKYRDIFITKRVYGYSNEEISKLFNISVETVKKRLTRAKQKIIKEIEKEGIYDE